MKPAICCLCGKSALDDKPNQKSDWVEFKNYREQASESLSHPVGLEFFCYEHLPSALNLADLTSDEALDKLKIIFPEQRSNVIGGNHTVSWWRRLPACR